MGLHTLVMAWHSWFLLRWKELPGDVDTLSISEQRDEQRGESVEEDRGRVLLFNTIPPVL